VKNRCALIFAGTLLAAAHADAQAPVAQEFTANTTNLAFMHEAAVASQANGGFVIVWATENQMDDFRVAGQRFDAGGQRLGGEFLVAASTTTMPRFPRVAVDGAGGFVVVWNAMALNRQVFGRRFDAAGVGGAPFRVHLSTTGDEFMPDVAMDAAGNFVVAWTRVFPTGTQAVVQRFAAGGARLGAELLLAGSGNVQIEPQVGYQDGGDFVAAWVDFVTGGPYRVVGQRFAGATGSPIGGAFEVFSSPTQYQGLPALAMKEGGAFSVVWTDEQDGPNAERYRRGRSFGATGVPLGPDRVLHTHPSYDRSWGGGNATYSANDLVASWTFAGTPAMDVRLRRFDPAGAPRGAALDFGDGPEMHVFPRLSSDPAGNVVAVWLNNDDSSIRVQRFGLLGPVALSVDPTSGSSSDGNGVLEPDEIVDVRPSWQNNGAAPRTLDGLMDELTGPAGGSYLVTVANAPYGTLAPGASQGPITPYRVTVTAATRPVVHWDAVAGETMGPDAEIVHWPLHIGDSFTDVPRTSPFYRFAETMLHRNVTAGCQDGTRFCPASAVTREQIAPFLLTAKEEPGYAARPCETAPFGDVPVASPFCGWIQELARRGVTSGCGEGNFCPGAPVSREQMAVFLLRTLDPALDPPACGTPVFSDVPASSPFCRWIEELARRGITSGCGGGNFCPQQAVSREQMAVFLTTAFGLTLYGP